MLPASRLTYITNRLTSQKFVSVDELSQELNVSGETIRRDLKLLEEQGILKRTYGGAYLEGSTESDVNVQVRKSILLPHKEQIANLCCQFIRPDDTIFLDSSTTSLEIAKRIVQMPVTVITNSLMIISYLSNHRNVRVIAIGGILDVVNMCFTGKSTLSEMSNVYARKGFISCRTLSSRFGVMDSNEQIGQVRTIANKNCYKNYLVVDHTKFGNTSMYKIADFRDFDAVITDKSPSLKWIEMFENLGIPVYYPEDVLYPRAEIEPGETEE